MKASRKLLCSMRASRGFSLVELIGAIVVILILCSLVLIVSGTARTSTLATRVSSDLEAINTAKTHWSLDNPGGSFPAIEPAGLHDWKLPGPGAGGQHDQFRGPQRAVLHQPHRNPGQFRAELLAMKAAGGYSMVEVVSVLVLLFILMGVGSGPSETFTTEALWENLTGPGTNQLGQDSLEDRPS